MWRLGVAPDPAADRTLVGAMLKALRGRVFTKFWKHGAQGGSGLGLYIVNGLVRAHGGELAISDAPGGGARIVVDWPERDPRP